MKHHNKKYKIIVTLTLFFLIATFLLILPVWAREYNKGGGYYDREYMDSEYKGYNRRDGHRSDYKKRRFKKRGLGKRGLGFFGIDVDENQDGRITREEAQAFSQKIFGDIDADNNESLSSEEFVAHHQNRAKKLAEIHYRRMTDKRLERIKKRSHEAFSRLDKDKNEQISAEEFYRKRIGKVFKRLDKNENGVITKDEMRKR